MQRHDSMRGYFAYELYQHMKKNDKIWVIVGDLGYGMFDAIKNDFPDRFINTGAAEQAMMGVACGLALEGKIPFVYSITTFLLYRPFETILNYVDYERIPVKLVGGGRDKDYAHDGISHWPLMEDILMKHVFKNIQHGQPDYKEDIPDIVNMMVRYKKPYFVSLRR